MFSPKNNFIGITLNENTVDIVQLKKAGSQFRVVNVVSESITGVSEQDLPKCLQNALRGFQSKSAEVIYVLPSHLVTTKNIEIPSTDDEEIKSIVSLQAGRHTPFSREEIEIGYINNGIYKTTYTKVLLAIANKGVIKDQIALLEKVGICVSKVVFAAEGIAGLFEKECTLKGEGKPVGLIDIGENCSDFYVISNGKTMTTRNIPFGKKQIVDEGDSAKAMLIDEFKQTIEAYQSEDAEQEAPLKYLITTDDDVSKNIKECLETQLQWNVEIVPYVDQITTSQGVIKKIATQYPQVSFLSIIASVSAISALQIDLFPDELKLQKSIEHQGKEVVKTTVLVFIVLILLSGFLGLRMYFFNSHLTNLKKDYNEERIAVTQLKNTSNRIKMLERFFEDRMVSLDLIDVLYGYIPHEVYISSLSMDEKGVINLQGIADTASIVFNLGTDLKESDFFDSVEIKSTSSKKDRGKDVSAFEILLQTDTGESDDVLVIE